MVGTVPRAPDEMPNRTSATRSPCADLAESTSTNASRVVRTGPYTPLRGTYGPRLPSYSRLSHWRSVWSAP